MPATLIGSWTLGRQSSSAEEPVAPRATRCANRASSRGCPGERAVTDGSATGPALSRRHPCGRGRRVPLRLAGDLAVLLVPDDVEVQVIVGHFEALVALRQEVDVGVLDR